jgi:apolipoprotein D and lipocalin family protein
VEQIINKTNLNTLLLLVLSIISLAFISCASLPKGVTVVEPFDSERYLGFWYEIARIDFSFEKGLDNTSAEYSLNPNGTVKVVNRGIRTANGKKSEAKGTARFRYGPQKGALEVSFFGPFYAPYNVLAIDDEYQHALVSSGSFEYLWILSRKPTIDESIKQEFLAKAKSLGFDTNRLLWVQHNQN